MGTEDCLKLNVYTHSKVSIHHNLSIMMINWKNIYFQLFKINENISLQENSDLKPVMVYIHGGAWFLGSGNGLADMYGPRYFLDRDIVLVTFNYRLGPLGLWAFRV